MANRKSILIRILTLVVLVGAAAGGLLLLREEWFRQYILGFLTWAREHKVEGLGGLVLVYMAACVLLIPGSLITLGAGFAFGVGLGFAAVFVGANLGAAAAFLLGRTLARGWIERRVAGNTKFRSIDQAIGQEGFKIVLLLRLSPIFPFNLLNYALGLTQVSFRAYCLASLIGMVPGILMYVYLGSLITSVTELVAAKSEKTTGEKVLFYAGLAATVLVTVLITRVARRALAAVVPDRPAELPRSGEDHG